MEKRCPGCPAKVPIVQLEKGHQIVSRLQGDPRLERRALLVAFSWLATHHDGLTVYAGIAGRPYTTAEKDAIALDAGRCSDLPCPFFEVHEGCMLGGLGDLSIRNYQAGVTKFGWLPTLIARELAPADFRQLVRTGQVADIKVALLNRPAHFPVRPTRSWRELNAEAVVREAEAAAKEREELLEEAPS